MAVKRSELPNLDGELHNAEWLRPKEVKKYEGQPRDDHGRFASGQQGSDPWNGYKGEGGSYDQEHKYERAVNDPVAALFEQIMGNREEKRDARDMTASENKIASALNGAYVDLAGIPEPVQTRIADTVSDFSTRYPNVTENIDRFRVMPMYDDSVASTSLNDGDTKVSMDLNSFVFDSDHPDRTIEESYKEGFLTEHTVEGAIAHEMGHVAAFDAYQAEHPGPMDRWDSMAFVNGGFLGDYGPREDYFPINDKEMSTYGIQNFQEYTGEVFGKAHDFPDTLTRDEAVYMNNVLRAGGTTDEALNFYASGQ